MEKILGYSALEAGVAMLPMLGTFGAVAFLSERISARVGMRQVILAGTALLAAGPLLLGFFDADSGYGALVPGLLATGIGAGLFYPTITTAAVGMLDASRSSLAGGIAYMFQVAGGAVGLGLATTLFTIRSEDRVESATSTRSGSTPAATTWPSSTASSPGTDSGKQAFAGLQLLGRRQGPRRRQGVIRRRRPVQLPRGRRDRAGRARDGGTWRQAREPSG